ncbi:MAG: uncharacterized protein K0S76_338 [Herbinix sp.]|jgi:uncharacterized membrane protein YbaN (DUF454 family)|nr:uncharacterized protein [Herbinix sp.]
MNIKTLKKCILIFLGSVTLVLGFIGVFLPVLPTTPFLLISSFCYVRSSKRMYDWLMNHKIFGPYLYNYMTHKAISKNTKIYSIVFLWSTLMISMFLISSLHIRIFLVIIGIVVSIHLMTLKTLSRKDMKNLYNKKSES